MGYTTLCACGAVLNEGDMFCCNCGKPVQKALGPVGSGGKYCTCGALLEDNDLFCPNCGKKQEKAPVPPQGRTCVHCGEKLEADDLFCPNCGKPVQKALGTGGAGTVIVKNEPVINTAKARGEDVLVELVLNAREAASGCQRDVSYSRDEFCNACNGTGYISGTSQLCPNCKGRAKVSRTRKERVYVPAGIGAGQQICAQGCGGEGTNGGENGDLLVKIQIKGSLCIHCGALLAEGDLFCSNCGKSQQQPVKEPEKPVQEKKGRVCSCGAKLQESDVFCPYCGKPQQPAKEPEKPVQEKKGRVCSCGAELQESDVFCPNCGERMEPSAGSLKGLDIFKQTPKTNCKECGCPTCMAFSMKVAQGAAAIDQCPYFPDDAKTALGFPVTKRVVQEVKPPVKEEKVAPPVVEEKPIIPEVKLPEIKKPAEDAMAKFRRRRVCPDCKLMFAADKETCPICGSPLVDKK